MASRYVFGENAEAPGHAASRRKREATSRAPEQGPKPDENTTTNGGRVPGGRMRIDGSPRPAFSRILLRDRAEAAPFIETRRAACDGML